MNAPKFLRNEQDYFPINKLCDELQSLIFKEVFLNNPEDLLQICLVSRKFYMLSTPWLYRGVRIDFSKATGVQLLARLARPGSKLPAQVRTLSLSHTEYATRMQIKQLCDISSNLNKLEILYWDGFVNVPYALLNAVNASSRQVRLSISATQIYRNALLGIPHPKISILRHNAMRLLTSFAFQPSSISQFYPDFKLDLIHMLSMSSALKTLAIEDGGVFGRKFYSDALPLIRQTQLPQLETLHLLTDVVIFTRQELGAWGRQGGWLNLKTLHLYDGDLLPAFFGRVPQLEALYYYDRDDWDSTHAETYLDALPGSPLGNVRTLVYQKFAYGNDLITWWMLKRVSTTLTRLDISHQCDGSFDLHAPKSDDIRRLQELCGHLQFLQLDVMILNDRWPMELLSQLALFGQPIKLRLCLHQPFSEDMWDFPKASRCGNAFNEMVKVRKLGNLPILPSANDSLARDKLPANCFSLEIKIVRPLDEMEWAWDIPEFTFWKDAKEHTMVTQRMTLRKPKTPDPLEFKHLTYVQIKKLEKKLAKKTAMMAFVNYFRRVTQDQLVEECEDKLKKQAIAKALKSKISSTVKNKFGDDEVLFDMWI